MDLWARCRRRVTEENTMLERITVAIDSDPERSGKVVAAVEELASAGRSTVFVVHVREVERPTAVAGKAGVPPSLHFESEETASRMVDQAVNQLRGAGVTAEGEVGPGIGTASRELLEIARGHRSTLIVIGDRRRPVSDALLGSVAHRVVHLAHCPVLLVR
jgi:nucleotide-binding universal stress UspA family protein